MKHQLVWAGLTVSVVLQLGCSSEMSPSGGDVAPRQRTEVSTRAGTIATAQRNAGPRHAVRFERGELLASASGFDVRYRTSGVEILTGSRDTGMSLARAGCEQDLDPVTAADPEASGNRVNYRRFAAAVPIDEWYLTGPLGLEQGFTVHERPACADGKLALEVALAGLQAEPARAGELELMSSAGERFRYSELHSVDAGGRALPSRMEVAQDGHILLVVDVSDARFPVTVDPTMSVLYFPLYWHLFGTIGENFGASAALSGNTAIFGAPTTGAPGFAYVFVTPNIGAHNSHSSPSYGHWPWTQEARLSVSGAGGGVADSFGASVALDGDRLLVGAPKSNHAGVRSGAAYLFERSAGVWTQVAKLTALDGAANDRFGDAVALSGTQAMIGATGDDAYRGGVYLFQRRTSGVWEQSLKLRASDGTAHDAFGYRVAFDGRRAIVGAPLDSPNGSNSGSAYVFELRRFAAPPFFYEQWEQLAKLVPADGESSDHFGSAVALSGNTVLVGAPFRRPGESGAVYVSERSTTTGWSAPTMLPGVGREGMNLGYSVALDGDAAIVGEPEFAHPESASAGYCDLYTRSTAGVWDWASKVYNSPAILGGHFGAAVAIRNGAVAIGGPNEAWTYSLEGYSCWRFCGGRAIPDGCWCDTECATYGDCCSDYSTYCE